MKQITVMEKYPVFTYAVKKEDTTFKSVDEVLEFLNSKISEHPVATFIAIFDHYSHTKGLKVGEISEDIKDAKNIVFCFGKALPNPQVMAVRPRSIAVAELSDSFEISFMQAPNPDANDAMQNWVKAVANK